MPVFNNILRILIILRLAILANQPVEAMKPVLVSRRILCVLKNIHHTHSTPRKSEYIPVFVSHTSHSPQLMGSDGDEPARKKRKNYGDSEIPCPFPDCKTPEPVSTGEEEKKGRKGKPVKPLKPIRFHNQRKLRDHLEKKHDRSHPEFFPLWAATFENADEAEKAWERRVKKHGPDYIPRPNVKLPE